MMTFVTKSFADDFVSPVVVATGREEIVAIFTGVLHMQGSPECGLIAAGRYRSFNIFGGSQMFRNACGRSNETESWGQCNFFLYKSAFLRFCVNKKKMKMLTEIVTVCTGELTGHGFQGTDLIQGYKIYHSLPQRVSFNISPIP